MTNPDRLPILPLMTTFPSDDVGNIRGIGVGTKLLVETMTRLYGDKFYEANPPKMLVVNVKRRGGGEEGMVRTMVFEADTLMTIAQYICRRMNRRRLLGLRAVFARTREVKARKAADALDCIAAALAQLAIQLDRRKRCPVRRCSSVGGVFDRLYSAWTMDGAAMYLECLATQMLEELVERKGLN